MTRSTVLASLSAALVSCGGGGLGGILISNEEEVELGQGVDEQIEIDHAIATADDPITVWAQELVAKLAPASKRFRDPEEFGGYKVEVIVDDELVNAFAAPGGFVYITTGLVLQAKTCGEIAGVLGHELGHVTERHGVKQLEEALIVEAGIDLFVDDELAEGVGLLAYDILFAKANSQEAESEADDVGLQIAHDGGYNPFGLVRFFEALLAIEEAQGGIPSWLQFLSTHPATQDRVDDVTARIEELYGDLDPDAPAGFACQGTTMDFEAAKAHVEAKAIAVRPGTGQGRPEEPTPEAEGEAPAEPESK